MQTLKAIKIATLSALLLGTIIVPKTISAEAVDLKSKGRVNFVEGTTPTKPVDPTNPGDSRPGKPINPINPDEELPSGTAGPLSMDFVSYFNFGEQVISTKDQTYKAAPQEYDNAGEVYQVPNYVQITDKRASKSGWVLTVKQDEQFKGIKSGRELKGAQISLLNAQMVTTSEGVKPSYVTERIDLNPGMYHTAMEANNKEGFGTYVYRFGDIETLEESVELKVPGSSVKKVEAYETQITWTISDVP